MEIKGEEICFLCGARYTSRTDKRMVVSDDNTRVYYVNRQCYARVRDMKRAHGVSAYQGLVMLGQRLETMLFGRS